MFFCENAKTKLKIISDNERQEIGQIQYIAFALTGRDSLYRGRQYKKNSNKGRPCTEAVVRESSYLHKLIKVINNNSVGLDIGDFFLEFYVRRNPNEAFISKGFLVQEVK